MSFAAICISHVPLTFGAFSVHFDMAESDFLSELPAAGATELPSHPKITSHPYAPVKSILPTGDCVPVVKLEVNCGFNSFTIHFESPNEIKFLFAAALT